MGVEVEGVGDDWCKGEWVWVCGARRGWMRVEVEGVGDDWCRGEWVWTGGAR